MKITGDLHTHTTYSHGKATIEENIKRAIELGLDRIVISDHGSGHYLYGVKRSRWMEMRRVIDGLRKRYTDIEILLGVEANIIGRNGDIDVREDELQLYDVLYVGYHYSVIPYSIGDFFSLFLFNTIAKVIPNATLKRKVTEMNTKALLMAMDRYPITMITHPGAKIPVDIQPIAKKAAEKGIILEINAHHGHLTREEIKVAMKYNVKFAINSDSHNINTIGHVERGLKRAKDACVPIENIINVREE